MALFYGLPCYYIKYLTHLQEKNALFQKKAFFSRFDLQCQNKSATMGL